MNVAFYTLGCKVNQYETEAMREAFEAAGHTAVPDSADFDAVVINSCTVTAESDRKTRQAVRRFRKEHPSAAVVLTGCMSQAFPEKAEALAEADVITGNTDIKKTVAYTEKFIADGVRTVDISSHPQKERFNTPTIKGFAERTRAYMKIEDGCERYCTYCIIPTARGYVRSKPLDEIRSEAEALCAAGFTEIVLTGINLTAYGKETGADLCDAVDAVSAVSGIKRVRLGSLEPDHMSDGMLSRLAENKKFCPQFHLSLQSGCDSTLKRMNRHYDTVFYSDLVQRIRKMFPFAAITTDVMVGFPGETKEEFAESLGFVKKTGFAKVHIFAYSRRTGTIAAALPNQISRAQKAERSHAMSEAALECEAEFLRSMTGKTFPVLFESCEDGVNEGYTPNYSRVKVSCGSRLTGRILDVKIISAEKECCIGVLTEIPE